MSTLKVNRVEHTGTTDGGIQLDTNGHVSLDGLQFPTSGALSNRNLIINGAMRVAQRATQVTSVNTSGFYTCDRFKLLNSALGTWTVDQSTDAPTGFSNSLKLTCTTAATSIDAAGYCFIQQLIEGQDLQVLGYGSSIAKSMTISFWVKSNKAGDASFDIRQYDNSYKSWGKSFEIFSEDEWEYKTLTIPGDTAGVINDDNGAGLQFAWWLNSGSNYTGGSHHTTWAAHTLSDRNASNLGVGGAVDDYFAITGVQLEVGDMATPFEHRSFDSELSACYRYYQKSYPYSSSIGTTQYAGGVIWRSNTATTVSAYIPVQFRHEMRDTPDITCYGMAGGVDKVSAGTGTGGTLQEWNAGVSSYGATAMMVYLNGSPSTNYYNVYFHYLLDAEL